MRPSRGPEDEAEVASPDEMASRIDRARLEIDAIDRAIVRQLAIRAGVVAKIARIRGAERRDPKREREVVRNAVRFNRRTARKYRFGYPDGLVADIFKVILKAGGAVQAEALALEKGIRARSGDGRPRRVRRRRREKLV
ncbi:MAG TPA: chorismate mutase [Thermoanaerobaculia bacterium]|nr:chorismate mutase [Thermoanaerobaculia bacterium]